MNKYKYIFGPVKSRRLGISLGIDILPHKTCSFNCIYCECGKTTLLTTKRKEYIKNREIISEIKTYLSSMPKLDYITFSGSGEPTLHKNIKKIIDYIKKNYPQYKVALLTNSSLFSLDDKLFFDVSKVDTIIASLDSASQKSFEKLNRPQKGISIKNIIDSLVTLRKNFKNELRVEIFFVKGINSSKEELIELKKAIKLIKPDKIEFNTLDRPGTENYVTSLTKDDLKNIEVFFETKAIIEDKSKKVIKTKKDNKKEILETIRRRPSRAIDIAESFGITINEAEKKLNAFESKKLIKKTKLERGEFYSVI